MLKVRPYASNMTILETSDNSILFSYQTPVAAFISGLGLVKTSKKWSVTTSKHINKWVNAEFSGMEVKEVEQSILDNLTK